MYPFQSCHLYGLLPRLSLLCAFQHGHHSCHPVLDIYQYLRWVECIVYDDWNGADQLVSTIRIVSLISQLQCIQDLDWSPILPSSSYTEYAILIKGSGPDRTLFWSSFWHSQESVPGLHARSKIHSPILIWHMIWQLSRFHARHFLFNSIFCWPMARQSIHTFQIRVSSRHEQLGFPGSRA